MKMKQAQKFAENCTIEGNTMYAIDQLQKAKEAAQEAMIHLKDTGGAEEREIADDLAYVEGELGLMQIHATKLLEELQQEEKNK